VRTTVTLDKDVERMLRDAMHRSRKSFKDILNESLRDALGGSRANVATVPFVVKARPLGLRAGIDPTSLNKLVDDLEVDAFIEKAGKLAGRKGK
jgi:hypothetical protein